MNIEQITQEIRDLNDRLDRLDVAIDECITRIDLVHERAIPTATADLKHAQTGLSALLVNQAGTLQKLALQVSHLTDEIQLLNAQSSGPFTRVQDRANIR